MVRHLVIALVVLGSVMLLGGCGVLAGFGKDVQAIGGSSSSDRSRN
ncbi:MAG: entericidin [Casimicrobiaceae bacterium]